MAAIRENDWKSFPDGERVGRDPIARAFRWACLAELRAYKPGNVSVRAPGHGMRASDFSRSARQAAAAFARPALGVGELIHAAVRATRQEVGCNTNLGIVLLCAPLARAARIAADCADPGAALERVLAGLSRNDAHHAYAAIRLAAPGGLGRGTSHDVWEPVEVGLLEAMCAAAERDRIAYQYAHDYVDVLALGVPLLSREIERRRQWSWAAVAVYLEFLGRFPDTHIRRKYGDSVALQVMTEAQTVRQHFHRLMDTRRLIELLAPFDGDLKRRGLNPGTSADLTVATLFAHRLGFPARAATP